jgi:hypothetical protein
MNTTGNSILIMGSKTEVKQAFVSSALGQCHLLSKWENKMVEK